MTHKKQHSISSPTDHDTSGLVPGQILEGGGDRIISSGVYSSDVGDAVSLKHQQNTDQYLDQGGPNQVSALELRNHLDTFKSKNVVVISAPGSYSVGADDDVIVYTSGTGVLNLTLPDPSLEQGRRITVLATTENNTDPASKPRVNVSAGGAPVGSSTTYLLPSPSSASFVSTGSEWAAESSLFGYSEKHITVQDVDSTASPYTPVGYEEAIVLSGTSPVTVDLSGAPKDHTSQYLIYNNSTVICQVSDAFSSIEGKSTIYLAPYESVEVVYGFSAAMWRIVKFAQKESSRTSTYTATATLAVTDHSVFANSTSAITLTLPSPTEPGHEVRIKNINTGSVTVDGGANTIDGAATFSLPNQYDAAIFIWNGSEWSVF